MNNKSPVFFILVLSLLFSCSLSRPEIKRISTFHYATNYRDSTKWLASIDIYDYQKKTNWKDDVQFNKTLFYNKDSSLSNIRIYYFNPSGEGEFFEFELIRQKGGNEESIGFYHTFMDTINNRWISTHYEQDGGVPLLQLSKVEIEYSCDSVEYTRVLSPSKEFVSHYRNFALMSADSIKFTKKLPAPHVISCTDLISSHYHLTESLSKENNYFREAWIDSTLLQGEFEVKKRISEYYYSEKVNELGLSVTKYKTSNSSYYNEQHTAKNDYCPIYQREIRLDPISLDTIYQMEMKSLQTGRNRLFSYSIYDNTTKSTESFDLRIPIIKREINIWTNKYGQMIKFHSIGYTNKGHKLEYAYEGMLEKAKVTLDNRIIPEISGEQKYDLEMQYAIYGVWHYYNPKQKKKRENHTMKRPTPIIPFDFWSNSKIVEKTRKENYEKWISSDSLSIYNVYYYKK